MDTEYLSHAARRFGVPLDQFILFLERASRDPAFWIESISGQKLWEKQKEICQSFTFNRMTCVPACNASGKTHVLGGLVAYGISNMRPYLAITTAPTERQVKHALWKEIRDFHGKARIPLPGKPDLLQWIVSDNQRALGFATSDYNPNLFQGIREANGTRLMFDEACFDDQTDVMTELGWRRFSELNGTERLITMDQVSGVASYALPTRLIEKRYQGRMLEYSPYKGGNFCVTPDHRMWCRQQKGPWRSRAMEDVARFDGIYMQKSIRWEAPDLEHVTVPAEGRWSEKTLAADVWFSLLGWYGSEGHLVYQENGQACTVGISQKDPKVLEQIAGLWRELGYEPKIYGVQVHVHDGQVARHIRRVFGGDGKQIMRGVPHYVKQASARQISLFLDSYARGDGYQHANREIIYTSSPRMADDLQELILKTGKPSVVIPRALAGRQSVFPDGHTATSTVDGFVVTRPTHSSNMKLNRSALREVEYDGTVYCATVPPHHLILTRRNGYSLWTGNCGITAPVFEGGMGIMAAGDSRMVQAGNPVDPLTQFREDCESPYSNTIRISAYDTPNFNIPGHELREKNFTCSEAHPDWWETVLTSQHSSNLPAPYLTTPTFVQDIIRTYGVTSPQYVSRVLGLFPEQSEEALFGLQEIEDAQKPPTPDQLAKAQNSPLEIGVDVARFGSNLTVIMGWQDPLLRVLDVFSKKDTFQTAERVRQVALRCVRHGLPPLAVKVDVIGVGGGVVDMLQHQPVDWGRGSQQFPVVAYNAASTENIPSHCQNARGHGYLHLKKLLEARDISLPTAQTQHAAQLRKELLSIRKANPDTSEKTIIMGKEAMKKQGLPSPDFADAAVIAVYPGIRPRGDYGVTV